MKLRKFLRGVTAAVTLVSLSTLTAYTAAAEETTVRGEYVTYDDDKTYNGSFIKAGDLAFKKDIFNGDDSAWLKVGAYEGNKEKVTEVVIPSYVKYTLDGTEYILTVKGIGGSAAGEVIGTAEFSDCVNLKSVTIPDTVEMLGYNAFDRCESLASIKLPKNMYVRSEFNPFVGCTKLESIEVDSQNQKLYTKDGVLFEKGYLGGDGETLICYPAGKTDKTYVIPDGVKITWHAINNSSLTALYVPKSANSSINSNTVYGCPKLTDLYFEGTEEEWNKETHYSENAVMGDDTLKNVTVHFNAKPADMNPEGKPAESQPATDETKFSDEKTGIEVTAKDGVLPEGVTFNAKLIKAQTTRYSYNLSFTDKAGNEVQPNGSVTVKIPLPTGFDTAYVYRVQGGKNVLLNSKIESGYVVFTTDHFSEYIISSKNLDSSDSSDSNSSESGSGNSGNSSYSESASSDNTTSSAPTTSEKNPSTGIVLSVLPVSAVICAAVVATKKRK